ncbi:MAG: ParB/RepB/Spo0J family partition protein [Candidatus Moranbacteria bacterium]|nr:ParB/RepB/Spo0J family partition protein [Candidatus Moranbacteria bacterium]
MQINGLGKGLSALIPDDLKKDFAKVEKEDKAKKDLDKIKVTYEDSQKGGKEEEVDIDFSKKVSVDNENMQADEQVNLSIEEAKAIQRDEEEFDSEGLAVDSQKILEIDPRDITVNKNQPRRDFDLKKLEALAGSIKQYGLLNPITVKRLKNGKFEIIAGERRFKASKLAGLAKLPAIVREVDDETQLELALIENIQREDLNPIEEALAYKTLVREFGLSQEEVAQKIHKSRPVVTNALRLLTLPQEIQQALIEGKINEAHARLILQAKNQEQQMDMFRKTIRHNLTVRNLKNILDEESEQPKVKKFQLSAIMMQREKKLSDGLGLKVKIKPKQRGEGGKIVLQYYTNDDLERLMDLVEAE